MVNFRIVLLSSLCVSLLSLYYAYDVSFYNKPDLSISIAYLLDMVFNITIIIMFFKIKGANEAGRYRNISNGIAINYQAFISKSVPLIFLLALYTLYLASKSFSLIQLGAVRQELISVHNTMGLGYMLTSGFFKIIFAFTIFYKTPWFPKICIWLGFFASMVVTGSRAELTYAGYMMLSLMLLSRDRKIVLKLFGFFIFFILFALTTTLLIQQREVKDGFLGAFSVVKSHFLYRAYSLQIAEHSINAAASFEKVLYPIFGYPLEWLLSKIQSPSIPINSAFVSKFHFTGVNSETGRQYMSNVVYPWWSWFFGAYGWFGIYLKFFYCYFILWLSYRLGLYVTSLYIICFILFTGQGGTFLMTLATTITLSLCIFIDIYSNLINKKSYSKVEI